jgi:release factor glutamine methyltransferase
LTAEVLLAFAIKQNRTYLYAHPEQELREVEWIHYGRYLHERLQHKPTQYITHVQEFYGREFYVSPSVLIPRPETEHVIEASLPLVLNGFVVDVGTGSGAIAITLALETRARVAAVDNSEAALAIAQRNAKSLGAKTEFIQSDALTAFGDGSATLILSNPPYVAEADRASLQPEVRDWEPESALFAGPTGLEFYERLIPEAARVLKSGGNLVLELGAGQSRAVQSLLPSQLKIMEVRQDLAGIERVLTAQKR